MSYLIFYILFVSAISLGSAASLLLDVFFFISLTHRRLKIHEVKNLKLLSGISTISIVVSIAALISLLSFRIGYGLYSGDSMLFILSALLLVAFACSLNMRNVHLPALKRHQHDYHHLSESFKHHQTSLLSTSVVSIVTWIFVLTLIAADARDVTLIVNFWQIIVSYIVIAYVLSKITVFLKRKIG